MLSLATVAQNLVKATKAKVKDLYLFRGNNLQFFFTNVFPSFYNV